jgi:hypothetical protein
MNIEQIVRYSLEYLNQTKYYHWQTKSYAQHQALGSFYDKTSLLVDQLVEAWSGRSGNIQVDSGRVELVNYTTVEDIIESAIDLRTAYEEFKETTNYGDVQNIIDEIVQEINQLIYLLKLV